MRKKFKSKKKKLRFKYKFFFFLFFFILGMVISYRILYTNCKKIDDKEFIKILLNNSNHHNKNNSIKKLLTKLNIKQVVEPTSILDNNYKKLVKQYKKEKKVNVETTNDSDKKLIYIYNTHQTEEYKASNFIEYSINPTVQMANYILEDIFNKNNLSTLTEEERIKDILNSNGWNYVKSYKASRILLEKAKKNNPSLKYFIDVHRDSLSKEKTTVQIDDKSYAKVLFLIGLENENYEQNLEFTTKINNKLNELYPNLSKGILKKGGAGVNGVYNQDFDKHTILIEIGGQDNTVDEVLNSSIAFARCFMEVIKTNEG